MLRKIMFVVGTAISLVLMSSGALAGEWNKAKGYIHGSADEPLPAASACAYSGLDEPNDVDGPDGDDNPLWESTPAGGIVQSYGQLVAAGLKGAPGVVSPGLSCRGSGTQNQ